MKWKATRELTAPFHSLLGPIHSSTDSDERGEKTQDGRILHKDGDLSRTNKDSRLHFRLALKRLET